MSERTAPDVVVYICTNCVPAGARLARCWEQAGQRVMVREIPCGGKVDAQYLMDAFEGGLSGVCVVVCPEGECQLVEGNYRARVRVGLVRRLLGEFGMEPERAVLLHAAGDETAGQLEERFRRAVAGMVALGPSPVRRAGVAR